MRYAIARGGPGLPPAAVQRDRLKSAGIDFMLEEEAPTRASQRALQHLLTGLKPGDEVSLCSLDALQMPGGELILLLQRFHTTGIKLLLVDADGIEDLTASSAARLLELMSRNEQRWPTRVGAERRTRAAALTSYQLRYARELRRRGETLRAIGLLFQIAPGELQKLLSADSQAEPYGRGRVADAAARSEGRRAQALLIKAEHID